MDWKLIEVAEVTDAGLGDWLRADRLDVKGWKSAAAEQVGEQAGDGQGTVRHAGRAWLWRWSEAGRAARQKAARAELAKLVREVRRLGEEPAEFLGTDVGQELIRAAGLEGRPVGEVEALAA